MQKSRSGWAIPCFPSSGSTATSSRETAGWRFLHSLQHFLCAQSKPAMRVFCFQTTRRATERSPTDTPYAPVAPSGPAGAVAGRLARVLLCAAAVPASFQVSAGVEEQRKPFDIPQSSLADALDAFSAQRHLQLAYDSDAVQDQPVDT